MLQQPLPTPPGSTPAPGAGVSAAGWGCCVCARLITYAYHVCVSRMRACAHAGHVCVRACVRGVGGIIETRMVDPYIFGLAVTRIPGIASCRRPSAQCRTRPPKSDALLKMQQPCQHPPARALPAVHPRRAWVGAKRSPRRADAPPAPLLAGAGRCWAGITAEGCGEKVTGTSAGPASAGTTAPPTQPTARGGILVRAPPPPPTESSPAVGAAPMRPSPLVWRAA